MWATWNAQVLSVDVLQSGGRVTIELVVRREWWASYHRHDWPRRQELCELVEKLFAFMLGIVPGKATKTAFYIAELQASGAEG